MVALLQVITRPFAVTVVAVLVMLQLAAQSGLAQPNKGQVSQIEAYSVQVDRFIKRTPKSLRIFANVAGVNDDKAQWREFRTEEEREKAGTGENLNENAYVWTRDRKIIGANFTFGSPSGDWAHLVMYYFRDDGTLAKIHAQLNTFYGDLSIVRDLYFDKRGNVLKNTRRYLDLKTQKPTKKPTDFFDHSIPMYRNVRDLPFHQLL